MEGLPFKANGVTQSKWLNPRTLSSRTTATPEAEELQPQLRSTDTSRRQLVRYVNVAEGGTYRTTTSTFKTQLDKALAELRDVLQAENKLLTNENQSQQRSIST